MQLDFEDLWDKFWHDKTGRVVIWQMPNALLIAWAILTFASIIFTGKVADVFSWLGVASLVIWSLLEIFKGVNYFRRLLGAVVLILAILTIVNIA